MPVLKHPLTGATYTLLDDGLIRVDEGEHSGIFHPDGRHESGELSHADLHLLGWLGGKQTPATANRHAAGILNQHDAPEDSDK